MSLTIGRGSRPALLWLLLAMAATTSGCRGSSLLQAEVVDSDASHPGDEGESQVANPPTLVLSSNEALGQRADCDLGEAAHWAVDCQAAAKQSCVAGTWRSVSTGNRQEPAVISETAHFAYRYAPGLITADQAKSTLDLFENIWQNHIERVGFAEPFCDTSDKHKVNVTIDA